MVNISDTTYNTISSTIGLLGVLWDLISGVVVGMVLGVPATTNPSFYLLSPSSPLVKLLSNPSLSSLSLLTENFCQCPVSHSVPLENTNHFVSRAFEVLFLCPWFSLFRLTHSLRLCSTMAHVRHLTRDVRVAMISKGKIHKCCTCMVFQRYYTKCFFPKKASCHSLNVVLVVVIITVLPCIGCISIVRLVR
jgi:hypothetical protein